MRKILGDDPVRVTVRLPRSLVDELRRAGLGGSPAVRDALRHYLDCPRLQPARRAKRAEQERLRAMPLQPLLGEAFWGARR